jgi:hypothetical protein
MVKQEITIITLKNQAEKYDNKEYETKDINRPHIYIFTLKNE